MPQTLTHERAPKDFLFTCVHVCARVSVCTCMCKCGLQAQVCGRPETTWDVVPQMLSTFSFETISHSPKVSQLGWVAWPEQPPEVCPSPHTSTAYTCMPPYLFSFTRVGWNACTLFSKLSPHPKPSYLLTANNSSACVGLDTRTVAEKSIAR